MCGLTGFVDRSGRSDDELRSLVAAMTRTLAHRGPDDEGTWVDPQAGAGLGSRRLAIVDLSPTGHQPLTSADGRYVVAYNGELYNHPLLRERLEARGHRFRGRSDTEVLVQSVSEWGLRGALERFVGMFAFALWDRRDRVLSLARDRMGEKPLYYGWSGSAFLFGSELKALRAHPAFSNGLDMDALALFFRHKYIPAPWSIYEGVRKLPPGTFLSSDGTVGGPPEPIPYWEWRNEDEMARDDVFRGDIEEAANRTEELLSAAVKDRMVADVPVGALLSGGIDSSSVVALMQEHAEGRSVRTFTVGLEGDPLDESVYAARVASHLGTDHTELIVTASDAMTVIPSVPSIYDEPFADSSQIPTFLISRLAREHVTVALSGDGGDELFGGYNRHTWAPAIWRRTRYIPPRLRASIGRGLTRIRPSTWESISSLLSPALPARLGHRLPGEKIAKLASTLPASSPEGVYRLLTTHWEPASVLLAATEPATLVSDVTMWPSGGDIRRRMMIVDAVTYLPDDILAKVDRASMATSLEVRVPLLDPEIVRFAWKLPSSLTIANGRGKTPLRRILARRLPPELIDRPKMGFGIPLGEWLRGPLRAWADDLLDEGLLRSEGILDAGAVAAAWRTHLAGDRNLQYQLWDVLMFQAWLRSDRSGPSSSRSMGAPSMPAATP